MKLNDVKKFCENRKINAAFVRVGARFMASIPKASSDEFTLFLDFNDVQHSQPCEVLKNYHDIYLSLSG